MWTNLSPSLVGPNMDNLGIKLTLEEEKRASGTSSDKTSVETVAGAKADRDSDTSVGIQGTTTSLTAGLHDLGLQKGKKRLSGAQQRKLIRENKMAAGTWTQHKPGRKNRERKGKAGPHEGSKRPREESKTPPQPTKKSRSSRPTGSYSEVSSELRMAIIDKRHPEITLDQVQADTIQERLIEALDGTPSGSGNPLQFNRTSFSGGVLWMTCANEGTKKWLGETVGTLDKLWEGADLTAVMSKDLPVRPRVLVFIPGPEEKEEAARARLGRQNPGLRVGSWLLLSRKVEKDGVILAYSLDESSFGVLTRNQNRAYYKLGRVNFKILKGLDGEQNKDSSGQPPAQ